MSNIKDDVMSSVDLIYKTELTCMGELNSTPFAPSLLHTTIKISGKDKLQ